MDKLKLKSLSIDETDWQTLTICLPKEMLLIVKQTIEAYKLMTQNENDIPAFCNMILEARSAVPPHVWDYVSNRLEDYEK